MFKAVLYTDGGARGNPGPAGFGALLFNENGELIDFTGGYGEHATNNFAEYSALLLGLKLAQKKGVTDLECRLDSELVVKQIKGEYKIKDGNIKNFYKKINDLLKNFNTIRFKHIPREENQHADRMVNLILDIKSNE